MTVQTTPSSRSGLEDAFPYGQCTWYVAAVCPWVQPAVHGNAYQWAAEARAGGLTVSPTPVAGAVLVLQPNTQGSDSVYGHVAWVRSVDAGAVTVWSANWLAGPQVDTFAGTPITEQTFLLGPGVSFIVPQGDTAQPVGLTLSHLVPAGIIALAMFLMLSLPDGDQ